MFRTRKLQRYYWSLSLNTINQFECFLYTDFHLFNRRHEQLEQVPCIGWRWFCKYLCHTLILIVTDWIYSLPSLFLHLSNLLLHVDHFITDWCIHLQVWHILWLLLLDIKYVGFFISNFICGGKIRGNWIDYIVSLLLITICEGGIYALTELPCY
jgi:hypothetical protein